jgi:hypothetical protein
MSSMMCTWVLDCMAAELLPTAFVKGTIALNVQVARMEGLGML